MKHGIIIFGPAGSGKTTLGKLTAENLKILFADIDDYIWRKDTKIPFSLMYSKEEKIKNLMNVIADTNHFVMAGSMDSFHEYFDSFFSLGVFLTAPAKLRIERVNKREYSLFGNRILPGGDMYNAHQKFLKDLSSYDSGNCSPNFETHKKWANSLKCPILNLDGSNKTEDNLKLIIKEYKHICGF